METVGRALTMTTSRATMVDMENIAAKDQAAAREREFDRRARKAFIVLWAFALMLGLYGTLAAYGVLPAMPWSPLGK